LNSQSFEDHELIFLGTGGGRSHCVTQYRHTGGFIYAFNGSQAHIDPGPGAIVYLNQLKIDRLKTKWIIVTHNHTDHCNDAPVIIESVHQNLAIPAGVLISPKDYIDLLNPFYKDLLLDIVPMEPGKSYSLSANTKMIGTKTVHSPVMEFGFIIHQNTPNPNPNPNPDLNPLPISNPNSKPNSNMKGGLNPYTLAYTSDTEIFPGFAEIYKGVDILIANILRPDSKTTARHTSVDQIIPEIKKIKPKAFIMTHFGAFMDGEKSQTNLVPQQVQKIRNEVGNSVKVIGAEDGLRLKIRDILD
jgi:ribonuclease BN (tRNA processing enzyme)